MGDSGQLGKPKVVKVGRREKLLMVIELGRLRLTLGLRAKISVAPKQR